MGVQDLAEGGARELVAGCRVGSWPLCGQRMCWNKCYLVASFRLLSCSLLLFLFCTYSYRLAAVLSTQALPTHKGEWGKTLYCYELDVRTLAWR